jgi:mgtE-like transporter
MDIFDKGFREILSSEIISVLGGLVAGVFLAVFTNQLLVIPGILILLPGFLEMRGNISGSLASRLSSGLFLGVIKPDKIETNIIKGNLAATFFLAIVISIVLGFVAFLFSFFTMGVLVFRIILIPLVAGIIANGIEILLTLFFTFYLFRKGHDPNNIMGPFITTTGDITSIVSLLVAMVVV